MGKWYMLVPIVSLRHLLPTGDLHSPEGEEAIVWGDSDTFQKITACWPNPIKINTRTGKVVDGNGRAYELLKRAADPSSSITQDTLIPFEPYTPDDSMFPF